MEKLEDIDSFLKNVDKISQLVTDLRSCDTDVQEKALADANRYIAALDEPCRTKVNKTTINTNPPCRSPSNLQNEGPENFMEIMEQDAEDRRVRRKAKIKKATALKEKGNEAYAREDYETAVKYYSDGLAELNDMQPLYTNRAQAYIKLGKYKEAISDCEWALKCNERCVKAYLHMGKAYLGLKKYNEARNCLEKIQEIEPKREKMVKEYLTQVDLEEEREGQERNAKQEFDEGSRIATAVPKILEKLSKPGQLTLYYCGGLEILSVVLSDCTGQTLFRLNNGFSVISGNETVRRCLLQETNDPQSQELCVSTLKVWRVACYGNDENQKMLMTCPVARESIVQMVTSEYSAVANECLALLCVFAQTPRSRCLIIDSLNLHTLVKNLMKCISRSEQKKQSTAVRILENFATENRLHIQLRDNVTDSICEPTAKLLRYMNTANELVLPSLISSLGSLAEDNVIRHILAHDPRCWDSFLVAIRQCCASEQRETLYPLLGLIINLSAITSPVIQEHAVSLCGCCLMLLKHSDGGIITRATGVLSAVLPQSAEAIQHVIQGEVIQILRRLVKEGGQAATKYAIKALTVCTAASHLAREKLVKSDQKLSSLRRLLSSSCDEMVSGNAALCLAHCLDLEGVATHLLGTDIVLLLLRRAAGDAERTAVQQNAAIALGKLCRSEPRHLGKLRELHGLEILHSCVKSNS